MGGGKRTDTSLNALSRERLAGFTKAPIAPIMLSLAEFLSAENNASAVDIAHESLLCWGQLSLDLAGSHKTFPEISVSLMNQLARVQGAAASLGGYGRSHLMALLDV